MSKPTRAPFNFDLPSGNPTIKPSDNTNSIQTNIQTIHQPNNTDFIQHDNNTSIDQQHSKSKTWRESKTRQGKKYIGFHIPEAAIIQMKIFGAQKGTTSQDMLTEALNDYFTKNGLTRLA